MEVGWAKEIIISLGNGVDPYTGEIFPEDSAYQNVETTRALYLALKSLDMYERRKQRENNRPPNAGNPWSSDEDSDLINGFSKGEKIKDLSLKHSRTEGAIRSRLIKHGKLIL